MKKNIAFLYTVFLFVFTSSAFSEFNINNHIESLKENSGENRVRILYDISTYYYIIDDSINFKKYGEMILEISNLTKNEFLNIDALNHLSYLFSYSNKKTSLYNASLAYEKSQKSNYSLGTAFSCFNIAYLTPMKDLSKKIDYYLKSINYAKSCNNRFIEALSNTYLGEIYSRNENISEAMKYYVSALKLYDNLLTNDSSIMTLYNYGELIGYLGSAFKRIKNYNEAEKYYLKYREISNNIGNYYGNAFSYNNLGNIYYSRNEYRKSLNSYLKAKEIFEENGITSFNSNIYNNIANIYSELKEYKNVEIYYKMGLDFAKKNNDNENIAKINFNWGDFKLKNREYIFAKKLFLLSLEKSGYQYNNIRKLCYLGLANTYDSLNRIKESYKYYKLYTELNDSLNNLSKMDEIAVMTTNYQNEKIIEEQKRINELKEIKDKEQQQRKYNLEYLAILIFLLIVFSVVFYISKFKISITKIETLVFISLLLLFEFIQVFFDPYINGFTGGDPIYNLSINIIIALLLTPIDTYSEKIIRKKREIKIE